MARILNDDVVSHAIAIAEAPRPVVAPAEAARQCITQAIGFCRNRLGRQVSPVDLLKAGDSAAHEYFRYGMGIEVAEYLADMDRTVKAVYICGWTAPCEEGEPDTVSITSPLSILVWVERSTAALESLLGDLDANLTEGYRALVAPHADRLRSLLDANVVDDEQVADRAGYGALVTALHGRPTRLWARQ